jgi:hypothetical protein
MARLTALLDRPWLATGLVIAMIVLSSYAVAH